MPPTSPTEDFDHLIIICGPSGAGKSTLTQRLLSERPEATLSVSHTTRNPRGQEVDGIDYHFVSDDQFLTLIEQNAFAEHATVHQHRYGTSFQEIEKARKNQQSIIFDIDYQGAQQLRVHFPQATSIIIFPPSFQVLADRLRNRSTDDPKTIQTRLAAAQHELKQWPNFTHVIINDQIEVATQQLLAIYDASSCRVEANQSRLESMIDASYSESL